MTNKHLAVVILALSFIPFAKAQETVVGTVPTEYPLGDYQFHVNPDTNRVWLVLRYGWPDTVRGGDTGPGLNSVPVTLDLLRFDPKSSQVTYGSGKDPVVCANVLRRRFIWWNWEAVIPTGRCVVLQREAEHVDPSDWQGRSRLMKDAIFKIR